VPANTIRAWVIGMIATTVVSAVNLLFSLRNPSINIYVYVVQLLAYPMGVGMAKVSTPSMLLCQPENSMYRP
jgi:hypothetical protein